MQRAPCGKESIIPDVSRGPTLGEQVYTYIRQRIVNGYYRPGQAIVESELATALKVSRTPVSNAVIMLKERGLIEERNGRFITLDLTVSDVIDLYQCRLAFDGLAAQLAATRITAKQLERLAGLLDVWGPSSEASDSQALWVADLSFHGLIYQASENKHLVRFSEIATDLLSTYRRVILDNLGRNEAASRSKAQVRCEHERILDALATRDARASEEAARDHVRSVVAYLERIHASFSSLSFEGVKADVSFEAT